MICIDLPILNILKLVIFRSKPLNYQKVAMPPLGPGSFASTAGVQRAGLVLREVLDRGLFERIIYGSLFMSLLF